MREFIKNIYATEVFIPIMVFYGWGTLLFFLAIGAAIVCCALALNSGTIVMIVLVIFLHKKMNEKTKKLLGKVHID